MKLLVVSLNYSPEMTSTGKYTGELAEWFAQRGHAVTAVAGMPHYPAWKVDAAYRGTGWRRANLDGVEVLRTPHYVPPPGKVTAVRRIWMETSFTLCSLRWWVPMFVRSPRYDAVITVCPPLQNAVLPWLYRWVCGTPWILHIQDFQVDAAVRLGMLRGGALGRALYALENFCLRQASRASSITPAMCRRMVAKGAAAERVLHLPNWADVTGIVPQAPDAKYRGQLGAAPDQLLVMYAGAMATKQGLDVVLDAAAQLRADPRFRFALVGDGSDAQRLRQRAEALALNNLVFLPPQPQARFSALLSAADLHLVVQKRDAADLVMPSKLTNILAAGRPAVATSETGTALWDVLEGAGAGRCVAPESAQSLVAGLNELAADPALRERMGERARAYAESHLDRDAILQRFERTLSGLIGNTKPIIGDSE